VMSTVMPSTAQRLQERLAHTKARVVDVPVSGGLTRAESGSLTLMVGGREEELCALAPVLNCLGKQIFYGGSLGAGSIAKLVNNILGIGNIYLAAEAYALALALGADLSRMVPILDSGTGRNFTSTSFAEAVGQYAAFVNPASGFYSLVDIVDKDLDLIKGVAARAGVSLPMLEGLVDGVGKMRDPATADAVFAQWQSIAAARVGVKDEF